MLDEMYIDDAYKVLEYFEECNMPLTAKEFAEQVFAGRTVTPTEIQNCQKWLQSLVDKKEVIQLDDPEYILK